MTDLFFTQPILNSPYEYPKLHWELDKDGQPTQKIVESRRRADFITPIPKPRKRTLKACLLERMAEIWNAPPKNAREEVPSWCQSVPAVLDRFSVISPENQGFWKGEEGSPIFGRRNIFAPRDFMFFL